VKSFQSSSNYTRNETSQQVSDGVREKELLGYDVVRLLLESDCSKADNMCTAMRYCDVATAYTGPKLYTSLSLSRNN